METTAPERLEDIVIAIQDKTGDVETLSKHLSESLFKILRRQVGTHHPNRGRDIIEQTHDHIIESVLRPETADGKALRLAFLPRVNFRLMNVITRQKKIRKIKHGSYDPIGLLSQTLDVDTILEDEDKAFRLYMDGLPLTSKDNSITKELGVCENTARSRIQKTRARLQALPAVRELVET